MSYYGRQWRIDGVIAGPIRRSTPANGQYTVIFEREFSSLEQIETINWAAPAVERLGADASDPGLPEGYGFEVTDTRYDSGVRAYQVLLKVESQYLGDVTGYQEEITRLEASVAEQAGTIEEQEALIQEQSSTIQAQDAQIQEQTGTIEAQAAEIEELTQAGSAAALEEELDAAYQEGVDSVE